MESAHPKLTICRGAACCRALPAPVSAIWRLSAQRRSPAAAGHVMPRDADLSVLSLQVQVECIRSAAARSQL